MDITALAISRYARKITVRYAVWGVSTMPSTFSRPTIGY
ncbi:Uncharacterised protein [Serratia fonticola]|uniref:Uncharacterized protein n=1 Tax=Serratia fonticola TaxID=47917 RepID=A0A4U9TXD0_SERFO|nr:Uncharacterised protein [Serratia fonticola]